MVSKMNGPTAKPTVLLPDDGDTMGGLWCFTANGKSTLVVKNYVSPRQPVRAEWFDVTYTWLYCYDVSDGRPVFAGKTQMETNETRSRTIECALGREGIDVWQTVAGPGTWTEMLRVAEWRPGRPLQWRDRYVGNDILHLTVAPLAGAKCIVREWKGPIDGAGFISGVSKDTMRLHPLGTYRTLGDPGFQTLAYLTRYGVWAYVSKSSDGVAVCFLDDKYSVIATMPVKGEGVIDFAVVDAQDKLCVVLVGLDAVNVTWLRPAVPTEGSILAPSQGSRGQHTQSLPLDGGR